MLKSFFSLMGALLMGAVVHADDLSYVDELFPHPNLTGNARLEKAAECTWEGDGRCYMVVMAETIRSYRNTGKPSPILAKHKLAYPTSIMGEVEYHVIGFKYNNYINMSGAIYYTHRWHNEGNWNTGMATEYFSKVSPAKCDPKDSKCWGDMEHYAKHVQNHYSRHCQ